MLNINLMFLKTNLISNPINSYTPPLLPPTYQLEIWKSHTSTQEITTFSQTSSGINPAPYSAIAKSLDNTRSLASLVLLRACYMHVHPARIFARSRASGRR